MNQGWIYYILLLITTLYSDNCFRDVKINSQNRLNALDADLRVIRSSVDVVPVRVNALESNVIWKSYAAGRHLKLEERISF
ncbi:hypothetical protein E0E54_00775 [Azotobacter chroococcum]|uniref:Uncharacterized protein n=1 Tax=Azotobacter chroococcum TaxID=353 RepID=A0A4Q9VW87_9GAMM|nr:hypothetical protein [Azotobacter chroococcum]QQE87288.1 hypothetical protein GKQ51_13320 [Azotobacter chroococcum]TBW40144.1 hypothetical protein E0E54_00775 [Azotobacter chroococcum]TKD46657.1 hypothetical protein FCG41_01570 [Azotobacter chroococcum]